MKRQIRPAMVNGGRTSPYGRPDRYGTLAGLLALALIAAWALAPRAAAVDSCANADVRAQQASQHLPECRAYEMVSPQLDGGEGVGGTDSPQVAFLDSADGSRTTYTGSYPLGETESGSWSGTLSELTASGWNSRGLLKENGPGWTGGALGAGPTYLRGSTPDQRAAVYADCSTPPFGALRLREADGTDRAIVNYSAPDIQCRYNTAPNGVPLFLGISDDGRHVVFNCTCRIGPAVGIPGSGRILYEWVDDGGAGTLRVVNRTDAATQPPTLLNAGSASLGGGTATAPATVNPDISRLSHAISADGSRILFQNPAPASASVGGGPLYMRIDGEHTVEISRPEAGYTPTSPPSATGIAYIDAARDQSVVYFQADGDLTEGAPETGGIYRYESASGDLTWIDAGRKIANSATGFSTGIADVDGSRLYYQGEEGSEGAANLKLFDANLGESRLVTSSTPVVFVDGGQGTPSGWNSDETAMNSDSCASANVSPDGRFFTFTRAVNGITPEILYYDADAEGGAGHLTSVAGGAVAGFDRYCERGGHGVMPVRVMSDDGSKVFLTTREALVPGDTNGPLGWDVYRWRAADGDLALITTGTGPGERENPQALLGTNADGSSVFFMTGLRLALEDGDGNGDVYVARVGGGFLRQSDPGCEGDACQGPYAPPPSAPGYSTSSVSGQGNASQAQRRSRCNRRAGKRPHRHSGKRRSHHRRSGERRQSRNGSRLAAKGRRANAKGSRKGQQRKKSRGRCAGKSRKAARR